MVRTTGLVLVSAHTMCPGFGLDRIQVYSGFGLDRFHRKHWTFFFFLISNKSF
jgi:hypothetical protein